MHCFDEPCTKAEFLLLRPVLSCQKLYLLLLLEAVLLQFGQFGLGFMQFPLKSIVGSDGRVLLYEFAASALELLLESCFEIAELLVFGSKRIAHHVQLALQLSDFLLV